MKRVRLAALFFAPLCLLLYSAREAAGQSPRRRIALSPDAAEPASDRQQRARPIQRRPRGPEIFYCETPDTSCRTAQDAFSLAELRDLYVFVVWPGVKGQHVQTVEFFLPDGSLYSSKRTQFTLGGPAPTPGAAPAPRDEDGPPPVAPRLIPDANQIHEEGIPSLLMKSRGDASVVTVLPVGGTYITQRNLGGVWRVRVFLDDRLALESAFTLVSPRPAAKTEERSER